MQHHVISHKEKNCWNFVNCKILKQLEEIGGELEKMEFNLELITRDFEEAQSVELKCYLGVIYNRIISRQNSADEAELQVLVALFLKIKNMLTLESLITSLSEREKNLFVFLLRYNLTSLRDELSEHPKEEVYLETKVKLLERAIGLIEE